MRQLDSTGEPQNNHSTGGAPQQEAGFWMRARTLILVAAFLIFGFGLLIYQLYALQLRDRDSYRSDAAEQQLSDTSIPAARGSIYDATGKLLAKSTVVWNVTADPSKCSPEILSEASQQLAAILGGTADDLYQKLSDSTSQYKILAKKVDMPTAQSALDYASTLNTQAGKKVLSLSKEEASTREYPYGAFLSSVLGFCNSDGDGFYGLEKSYDEQLSGTPGRVISTENALGYELANDDADSHDPIDGYNLNLSIDVNVQSVVEEYLAKAVQDYSVQNRASAIVMNVNTGEILAMATESQFDPNDPYTVYDPTMSAILANSALDETSIATLESRLGKKAVADIVADGTISDEEYTQLQGMMREAQWKNKAVGELYYPGSVFKLVTAAAALDSSIMNVNQTYTCNGELTVAAGTDWEKTYHCADGEVHGVLDMSGALNKSCNLYFIQVGQALGKDLFSEYFNAFGFTEKTGIDLPGESSALYYTADQMRESELASSAFGQAQKITPIQMATAIAAAVNGGYLVTPHVVNTVTDASGNAVDTVGTTIKRQIISSDVSDEIRTMMETVVGEGDAQNYHSGKNAYVAGYRIGGKSGTSEQLDVEKRADGDYRKVSSFAAVLPIDDPEIEVFVMMDDPRWYKDYASKIVAPVVGNIISEIAPYLGIERDPDYNASAEVQVPNCVGVDWNDAQVTLNVQGFGHKLVDGAGTVTYQYPYAGTSAPAGSTVYLYTTTDQDTMTTVPDVTGKSADFAEQMFTAAGLNTQISGDASGRVASQSAAGGASVPMGTVVTVTTDAVSADSADSSGAQSADSQPQTDGGQDAASSSGE
jgi:stage V sporulation protein D (sporulation-specific penicillin-binding protein)